MKYLYFLVALLFFGCQNEEMAGGPCSYQKTVYPATVIKVEERDSARFDALFSVKKGGVTDTISYFMLENEWLTPEKLANVGLVVGAVFKYEVDEIVSGSCTPRITRLVLENEAK